MTIVYTEGTLIFELIIPLLNPVELTLYHILPLPVKRENVYMHLTPDFEYMAISKSQNIRVLFNDFRKPFNEL